MTLKELLDQCEQEGSHKLSGQIYTQYREICVHWLLKQNNINDINTAKDIFTDAILIVISNAERGRIEPTNTLVITYLTTICRNTLSNLHKRKDKASEWALDTLIEEIAEENTDSALEKEALLVRIEKTMEGLQEPCATLFKLYYYEGYSHREIAVKQNYASENVSKSMLYKCKNSFGKLFGKLN